MVLKDFQSYKKIIMKFQLKQKRGTHLPLSFPYLIISLPQISLLLLPNELTIRNGDKYM